MCTMSGVNRAVETINAAATAIVSAESRVQQYAAPAKQKWRGYWCFGARKRSKRISHGVFVADSPGACPQSVTHSFIAPPSSPSSLLQSEPPSPSCLKSSGFASIFAIGLDALEAHLVTPPLFSGFNTEPSTAPFTPPPESLLTPMTDTAPEASFTELLTSSLERARVCHGEFGACRASGILPVSEEQKASFELSRSMTLKDEVLEDEIRIKRDRFSSKDFSFYGLSGALATVPSTDWGFEILPFDV